MAQTERNQEKVVVSKICFYGSAKIEQKIKVCMMENKGSVAKIIKMKNAEESIYYWNMGLYIAWITLNHTGEQKCTCVCMFTYTCTYGLMHIHMCKNMKLSYMYAYGHTCCDYVNKCTFICMCTYTY